MRNWFHLLSIVVLMMLMSTHPSLGSAQPHRNEIARLQIDSTPAANAKQLADRSTLIVEVHADRSFRSYPTANRIAARRIVNYVQNMRVKQVFKGSPSQRIRLLTRGLEPLPDASDILNDRYTGPLAEGDYVLFLHKVAGTDLYSLTGLWQGVYPVFEGKTVALNKAGFAEYQDLSLGQLKERLK